MMRVPSFKICRQVLLLSFVVVGVASKSGFHGEKGSDKELAKSISKMTKTKVYLPGSRGYETRRRVNNGLCSDVRPALIAVPKTSKHVSDLVRIAKYFGRPISVRSGGHSYTCTSIKHGESWNKNYIAMALSFYQGTVDIKVLAHSAPMFVFARFLFKSMTWILCGENSIPGAMFLCKPFFLDIKHNQAWWHGCIN